MLAKGDGAGEARSVRQRRSQTVAGDRLSEETEVSELFWARSTMALSLGFHIIFASISMVLPFFMAAAHLRYLRHHQALDLYLAKAWAKGAAVLFATGAVSGTALSFQLGLLWPGFMEHAGPIIGMPFSLEGAAFFLEAIFFGLYLYGWERLPAFWHACSGVMVGVCGLASGVLVIAANGWMNSPRGFVWVAGHAEQVDPWAAMFNEAWPLQAAHMLVAAVQATSLAAAGVHAWGLLRIRDVREADSSGAAALPSAEAEFHRRALTFVLPFLVVASLLQPVLGDLSAKSVAVRQPAKLAAFEAHFQTEKRAGLLVGGWPDEQTETVRWGVKIPGALSFLAHGDLDAEVTGLSEFAPEDRPPVLLPHLAFQVMVGIGTLLVGVSLLWLLARFRKVDLLARRGWLRLLVFLMPAGFIALEAGWIVTEVGRQPWIIYGILRTADAVTPVPGLSITFFFLLTLYSVLFVLSFYVLSKIYRVESMRWTTAGLGNASGGDVRADEAIPGDDGTDGRMFDSSSQTSRNRSES